MRRSILKSVLDLTVWVLAAPVAYLIRLDVGAAQYAGDVLVYTGLFAVVKAAVLVATRQHRPSWHRIGFRDLSPLVRLVAVVLVAEVVFVLVVPYEVVFVPRSVPLIEAMVAGIGLAGLRFAARLYFEERGVLRVRLRAEGRERRVLIAGAGEAGQMIAREMKRHPEAGRLPVGFVDDDPAKAGRRFSGVRVYGPIDDLTRTAERTDADEVLVAMPSAVGGVLRRIVEQAREAGIQHRTIPSLHDLASGRVSVSTVREVDVEDLLGRPAVRLDAEPVAAYLRGRCVLVTGAGGSIGAEVVAQVAAFGPSAVVLLGRGENSVFDVDRALARDFPDVARHREICDVRDEASLRAVFERYRPDVVFHAAAHKHVSLMEQNPEQAVLNNVGGTRNVARLAAEFGVRTLVNISTDKAVNPTSVMGASKRVAEQVVATAAQGCAAGCTMVSVRFGNVLGSRGSVVPIFREQIRHGGPVVVTHPDMVRYFMTIPEASQLVLQAGAIAENGRVYVLDMGEPVRIQDLARDLILLSGLEPGRDVEIQFSGTRPGEKLFEELLTAEEGTEASAHDTIFVARKTTPGAAFEADLAALFAAAERRDEAGIRAALRALVPTFVPAQPVADAPARTTGPPEASPPDAPQPAAPTGRSGDGTLSAPPTVGVA